MGTGSDDELRSRPVATGMARAHGDTGLAVRHRRRPNNNPYGDSHLPTVTGSTTTWTKRRRHGRRRSSSLEHWRCQLFRKFRSALETAQLTVGVGGILFLLAVIFWWFNLQGETPRLFGPAVTSTTLRRPHAPLTVPILVDRFAYAKHTDRSHSSFRPPIELSPEAAEEGLYVDYGDLLDLRLLEEDGSGRVIFHDWNDERGGVRHLDYKNRDDDIDQYYAFDDDLIRSPYVGYDDDTKAKTKQCRRTSWHRLQYPTCNEIHATDFEEHVPRYLSHGSYREVFLVNHTESFIFKQLRMKKSFSQDNFEFIRMDALVSERLTSEPRVVDIFGFCGMSMFTEFFPGTELETFLLPSDGDAPEGSKNFPPQNSLNPSSKIKIALEVAENIATLHNYEGGLIVHDDIQLSQFLFNRDGRLKINDFNRAEPMLWDEQHQEYCHYYNGPGQGSYRAPEEYMDKPLDEKIDIWSYGNILYSILTGLWNFYDVEGKGDIDSTKATKQKIINGEIPSIDPRYTNRSFEERKIVEIMTQCWKYKPNERPSIVDIIRFLRETIHTRPTTVDKK